jgi:hypothetical protein
MLPIFELPNLPPNGLKAIADYLEKLATFIRQHAQNSAQQDQNSEASIDRFALAKSEFKKLGQIVAEQISAGTPYKIAVQLTVAATGHDTDAVQFSYTLHQRQRRQNRATVIAWLKSKNWTDAAIAEVVDLHEQSVQRIRQK